MTRAATRLPLLALRAGAAAVAVARLSRGRRRRAPLTPNSDPPARSVSVVIPARNEEGRIAGCLQGLAADRHILEVLVVDDGSSDGTAALARSLGARVVEAGQPPPGWVGKPWALQRGLEEAAGEVVVSLDADVRPRRGLAAAAVAALADADLISVGTRFDCDGAFERWLHPAMLATLVYRFGPPDATRPSAPDRVMVSGQCTAVDRRALLGAGGYQPAAGHFTDDCALARALARNGWRIAFRDGASLVDVDMHESALDLWREWARTLALTDVTGPWWRSADVAVLWSAMVLPLVRVLAGRGDRLDAMMIALRCAITAATAGSYKVRGWPYWLSPLADPLAAARITISALHRPRRWRGREYDF